MTVVPTQPDRETVMDDLIDALRRFTVESDVFVDVFARAHGLGRSDLNAIMWISAGTSSGDPITVGELAQRLRLSPAAATALVDRLEAVGHVRRTRDPQDRRRVTVRMSETAMTVATAFFVPLGGRMRESATGFTEAELARAAEIVRRMTEAVTAASQSRGSDAQEA
ncbi:MarR family winged helix-turn-helix transcriptional regulator [Paractinoplanes globisporus]|uniref:MarR family winged helix-turn-helix transcriptional regulator n=1 Tax=Paractinoplanes globisporus TaxID=113565 RepID=A0ABW6W466_9ACTN|nr:MarR family transcriptional regulator [Actinoplanes globisporus]